MKKYLMIAAAAALSLALPSASMAGDGSCQWSKKGHGKHGMMKQADTNGDGAVDKKEFIAAATKRAEKHFARMDINKDGVLDQKDHNAHFDRLDTNHDGNISRDEFTAGHATHKNPCAKQ
jgi:Ca2+-binding EF-hand superfamily protein